MKILGANRFLALLTATVLMVGVNLTPIGLLGNATAANAAGLIATNPNEVCTGTPAVNCTITFPYSAANAYKWTPPAGMELRITVRGGSGGNGGNDTDSPWGGSGFRGGSGGTAAGQFSFSTEADGSTFTIAPGSAGGSGATDDGATMSAPELPATGMGAAGQNYYPEYNGGRGGAAGTPGWSGSGGGGGAATVLKIGSNSWVAGGAGGGVGGNLSASVTNVLQLTPSGLRTDAMTLGLTPPLQTGDGGGAGGGGGGFIGGQAGNIFSMGGERTGNVGTTGANKYPVGATVTVATGYAHGSVVISWTKQAQNPLIASSSPASIVYAPGNTATSTVTTEGGNTGLPLAYATTTTTVCSVNATTGVVTAKIAGDCIVTATMPGNLEFLAQSDTVTIPVTKNAQTPLVATALLSNVTYPTGTTVSTTGGAGTGAVTYASLTPTVCSVAATTGVITDLASGTCTIEATKAADANYTSPTSDTVSVEIAKGTQVLTANRGLTTMTYIQTTTASATSSQTTATGAVTYNVSTPLICSIDDTTKVITPITVGICTFTATKATDPKFLAATSAAVSLTITQVAQPALTATLSDNYVSVNNDTTRVVVPAAGVTGGGAGTGALSYATTTPTFCSVSATGVITTIAVGACTLTATRAADANYTAITSAAVTLYIRAQDQADLTAGATSLTTVFGTNVALSTTGGSGTGAVTYTSLTPTICTISGTNLVPVIAGTCTISATKAYDGTFATELSINTVDVLIAKANQAALVATPSPASIAYPTATSTVSAAGGSGTGAITWAVDPASASVCSINATTGVVTSITAGSCTVWATKAATPSYNSQTDDTVVTITKATQATLTAAVSQSVISTSTDTSTVSTPAVGVTGGGSGTGSVSFASTTPTVCRVDASTGVIEALIAGSCILNATRAADINYNAQTSANVTVTIKLYDQPALTVVATPTATSVPTTVALSVTQPTATPAVSGAITYTSLDTTICTVSGAVLTPVKAGTCQITATRAADASYTPITSQNVATVLVSKGTQATLTNAVSVATMALGTATSTETATGGSGTGALSYATSTPEVCTINATTGVITSVKVGTCSVTATKAATDSYNAQTSAVKTVAITAGTQVALTAVLTDNAITYTETSDVSATGGSGTGVISYSTTTTTICSVDPITGDITPLTIGTCTVKATKAADANYLVQTSAALNVTITAAAQAPLAAAVSVTPIYLGATGTTVASPTSGAGAGSGTGAVTYTSTTTAICTVVAATGVITTVAYGDCLLKATKAASTNFLIATSDLVTLTIVRPAQAPLTLSLATVPATTSLGTASTILFGDQQKATPAGGSGTGAVTYEVTAGQDYCLVDAKTGIVTPLAMGSCTIVATKAGDAAFAPTTSNTVVVTVAKGDQEPLTLSIDTATALIAATAPTRQLSVPATGQIGGGLGSGVVTYQTSTPDLCSVVPATGVVTPLAAGVCKLTATKAGNFAFNPITSNEVTLTITAGVQGVLTLSVTPVIIGVASTVTVVSAGTTAQSSVPLTGTTGGGNGTGAVTYAVTTGSTICSVDANTGVVTALAVGTCAITASKAADAAWTGPKVSTAVTVTVRKGQAALTLGPTTTKAFVAGQTTLTTITGGTVGAVTYASSDATICTVNATTGVVTAVNAGACAITATKAGDATYAPISAVATITFTKLPQVVVPVLSAPTMVLGGTAPTFTLANAGVTGGGLGTGAKSFATTTPEVCSINATTGVITALAAGACELTATRAGDASYYADTSDVFTLTINKANQVIVPVLSAATMTYGNVIPTFTLADAGLTGGGLGLGEASFATTTPLVCAIDEVTGLIRIITAGTCNLTATRAGDSNYNADTSDVFTLTINKANQVIVPVLSAETMVYGASVPTFTLAAAGVVGGGLGDGAASFATSTSNVCSIDSATGVITVLTAGTCSVTATRAGDHNYNADTSDVFTFTISKADQAPLVATASPTIITTRDSSQVSVPAAGVTGGGSGTGAVSFAIDPSTAVNCEVDTTTGELTTTSAATGEFVCKVNATRAGDSNYNTQVSNTVTVSVYERQPQATLIASVTPATVTLASGTKPKVSVPLVGIGSGTGLGAVTFAVTPQTAANCSVVATTGIVTGLAAGSCDLVATKSADPTYLAATSNTVTVTFTKQAQAPLTVAVTPATLVYSSTATATVASPLTGAGSGSGTGAVTYRVDSTSSSVCSVAGSVVTPLTAGVCKLISTKATDAQYEQATANTTLTITPGVPAPLVASISESEVPWNTSHTITASVPTSGAGSGSGTGAVTYRSTTPDLCGVNETTGIVSLVAINQVGVCAIVAVKTADAQYPSQVASAVTVNIVKTTQAALTASVDDSEIFFGETATVSAPLTGVGSGNGTGEVSYRVVQASASVCSVNGTTGVITAKTIGACDLVATKVADDLYLVQESNVVEVSIVKSDQEITFVPVNRKLTEKTVKLVGTSTSGSPVTYVADPATGAQCTLSGLTVTLKAVGACTITASAAGNATFNAAPNVTKTFQIVSASLVQTLTHTAPPATILTADDTVLDAALSSGVVPVITIATASKAICSVVNGELHGIAAGVCNYTVAGPAQGAYAAVPARAFTTSFFAAPNVTTLSYPTGVTSIDPRTMPITDELLPLDGASSADLEVTYKVANPAICWTDADDALHLESAGVCSITATSGGGDYTLSSSLTRTFTITKAPQVLTFTAPGDGIPGSVPTKEAPDAVAGGSGFKLSAVLDSGLQPVYRSVDPDICMVEEDGTVSWNGDLTATPPADTCRIGISNPGTNGYLPLAEQIFSVTVPTDGVEIPPVGGVTTEPAVSASLPRTGGSVNKGGIKFNVGITSKTFIVKPESKGLYIGPIKADIEVTYKVNGQNLTQLCSTNFGIVAKDTKGKPIYDMLFETPASVKGVIAPYLKMPKWGAKGYLAAKTFTNSASCTLNKEAFAYFKAGGVISAKATVFRDRRWPTTYKRQKPQGTPIYPTNVVWNLEIG